MNFSKKGVYFSYTLAMIDGKKRFVFSRERYEAIMSLGNWLAPSFPSFNPLAVDILVAKAVGAVNKKQSGGISFRELAEQFGLSHSTYHHALKRVSENLIGLENRAIDTLTPEFERDGVIRSDKALERIYTEVLQVNFRFDSRKT